MNLKEKLEAYSKVSPSGCWEWQRGKAGNGYGQICIGNQKQAYAHRVSYEIHHGPIPVGLLVRHKCDNPCCCNPEHLEIGTHRDNTQDCIERGRKTKPPVFYKEANCKYKLTDEDIQFILESNERPYELAKRFSVTSTRVCQIRKKGGR